MAVSERVAMYYVIHGDFGVQTSSSACALQVCPAIPSLSFHTMNHGFDFDSFSGHSTSLSPSDSGFNSSGLSLPPDIYTTSYSRAVELLNVAELMRNPHYMELHKKYDALRDQVMNLHGQIGKLNQRNTELMERAHRAELQG